MHSVEPFAGETIPLGDRKNMAYMSTIVTQGRGKGMTRQNLLRDPALMCITGVVVATGMSTQIGGIAKAVAGKGFKSKTKLQKR